MRSPEIAVGDEASVGTTVAVAVAPAVTAGAGLTAGTGATVGEGPVFMGPEATGRTGAPAGDAVATGVGANGAAGPQARTSTAVPTVINMLQRFTASLPRPLDLTRRGECSR